MLALGVAFSTHEAVAQKAYNFGDSLAGFDEVAAKHSALSEGFFGNEFSVQMYRLKERMLMQNTTSKDQTIRIF